MEAADSTKAQASNRGSTLTQSFVALDDRRLNRLAKDFRLANRAKALVRRVQAELILRSLSPFSKIRAIPIASAGEGWHIGLGGDAVACSAEGATDSATTYVGGDVLVALNAEGVHGEHPALPRGGSLERWTSGWRGRSLLFISASAESDRLQETIVVDHLLSGLTLAMIPRHLGSDLRM